MRKFNVVDVYSRGDFSARSFPRNRFFGKEEAKMPVLIVLGFSGPVEEKLRLIWDLKRAVAAVEELGVKTQQVTLYIDKAVQAKENEVIVVLVKGLFKKKERNKRVRQKLIQKIAGAVQFFLKRHGITATEFVEVWIDTQLNPEDGEYIGIDPRTWRKPEDMAKP